MIKITVNKGEEIIEKVTAYVKRNNITAGSLSLIGAVNACCIGTMPKENAMKDILSEYYEPLELSGTGEILEGKPHIHVVLAREDKSALAGHLHWGKVISWFVHVYLIPLTNK